MLSLILKLRYVNFWITYNIRTLESYNACVKWSNTVA